MRTTVRKWFWGWDFDKEEAWLNEMAAKGLALVSVGLGRYEFEETEPREYRVAMELLEHLPTHPESRNVTIRSIIPARNKVDKTAKTVQFSLMPDKVFLFDIEDDLRIPFDVQ